MSIAETVRAALADCGLSHRKIAEASGTNQRAVSDFLRGRNVNSDTLDRFAAALGAKITVPKDSEKKIRKCIKDT